MRVRDAAAATAPALLALATFQPAAKPAPPRSAAASFEAVRTILEKKCVPCHSPKTRAGGLDLSRFRTTADLHANLKPWPNVVEQVEAGQMPPAGAKALTAVEKKLLLGTVRGILDREARARADDPGVVPLRRLSNTEYDNTIRDLTGVDLKPTREFPPDGAGGEGFTNAGESLTDISPTLFSKYLGVARDIADHAVFTPEGLRFSASKTRRDWSDEGVAKLRAFYADFSGPDGTVDLRPYIDALISPQRAVPGVNPKYLAALRAGLADPNAGEPLRSLGQRIARARPEDAPALVAEIVAWRDALWLQTNVANYVQTLDGKLQLNHTRQRPVDPAVVPAVALRLNPTLAPGQREVGLYLNSADAGGGGDVVWGNPRFESPGKPPLLLRDYKDYGARYEIDPRSLFTRAATYLAGAVEAGQPGDTLDAVAKRRELDPALLKAWIALGGAESGDPARLGRPVTAVTLGGLTEQIGRNPNLPAVNGWHRPGNELPAVLANASDREEHIPGTAAPHHVVVHPTPTEFVAVLWTSPVAADVIVTPRIAHAHPACGNGVAWWLEHRRGARATRLTEDRIGLGGKSTPEPLRFRVQPGDQLLLAIDAKDGDHSCDLTDVGLTVDAGRQSWDLARDVSGSILDPATHGPWSFVFGPSQPVNAAADPLIPRESALGRWQDALSAGRMDDARALAATVQAVLAGPRPTSGPNAALWDHLVDVDSPLLASVDVVRLGARAPGDGYGTPNARFVGADLVAPANGQIVVRVPAALLRGRTFLVDGRVPEPVGDRVVRFSVSATPHGVPPGPVVGKAGSAGLQRTRAGYDAFRKLFPRFVSFPGIIPNDEVVSLKMFHRDDEPLVRLFLDPGQRAQLDRLWAEHAYVSRQAVAENAYLPQFIGFVTQDGTKEALAFFQSLRPVFASRAAAFERDAAAATPRQIDAVIAFADKAFRRPCAPTEKAALRRLYERLRQQGADHEDALRRVLARILSAPELLLRIERAAPSVRPVAVSDWELATRLSYFVWGTTPDDALRADAAKGALKDPATLVKHLRRMVADPKARALAEEFGAQWIHVRDFANLNEKNERMFPQFDAGLKSAIYEETVRFFQDLFQADRPVEWLLNANATFVNGTLAKHYGIPGVEGAAWRRVEGVGRYGRGGLLGLASVQTKESAASRTSPVLRGNWISETLLGEKLPRPPANVPKLPEAEGEGNLTVRQLTMRHVKDPACWSCHQRIDPLGMAMENYDAIGRFRTRDAGGLPIDASTTLRDGSTFTGVAGLKSWLLARRKATVVRVFSKRLLGYALGRGTTLSDTVLLERMEAAMAARGGRVSAALETIVLSPQFRQVRGNGETR